MKPSITLSCLLIVMLIISNPTSAESARSRDILIQSVQQFNQEPKIALVVGISQYDRFSGLSRLNFAHRDAQVIGNSLKPQGVGHQGFRVTLMINAQASKQKILERISELGKSFAKGKREGTFIFTFAGHGFGVGDGTYLATADATVGGDGRKLLTSGLRLMEVVNALKKTGARRIILMIDACRNNPFPGARGGAGQGFAGINPGEGVKILLSTHKADKSYEHPKLQQGVFSYFINQAFQKARDSNGIATFDAIANYVEREVPIWTSQNLATTQQPYTKGEGETYGDFVIISPKHSFVPPQQEELYWTDTKKCNQAMCYQNYLKRYPQGKYAQFAHQQVQQEKLNVINKNNCESNQSMSNVNAGRNVTQDISRNNTSCSNNQFMNNINAGESVGQSN